MLADHCIGLSIAADGSSASHTSRRRELPHTAGFAGRNAGNIEPDIHLRPSPPPTTSLTSLASGTRHESAHTTVAVRWLASSQVTSRHPSPKLGRLHRAPAGFPSHLEPLPAPAIPRFLHLGMWGHHTTPLKTIADVHFDLQTRIPPLLRPQPPTPVPTTPLFDPPPTSRSPSSTTQPLLRP